MSAESVRAESRRVFQIQDGITVAQLIDVLRRMPPDAYVAAEKGVVRGVSLSFHGWVNVRSSENRGDDADVLGEMVKP